MRLDAPLEAMYPNRCYDCLAECSHDELLCPGCAATLRSARIAPTDVFGRDDASVQGRSLPPGGNA